MAYGYRLFLVSVAKGPAGYSPIPMETAGDGKSQHYRDHVQNVLARLEKWGTLTGKPVLRGNSRQKIRDHKTQKGDRTDPRVRFLDHRPESSGVFFTLEYGRIGRFPKALAVNAADDAAIAEHAPSHPYRCLLLLPATGKQGVLAVEDIDGTTPARVVPNWLSRSSHSLSKKKGASTKSVRLMANVVKDLPRLRQMIESATDASLRLTKKEITGGSNRKVSKIKVEYKLLTEKDREDALAWAGKFAGSGKSKLKGDGIVEMADIVDGSIHTVGFTDAVVVIKSETDGTKKVGAGVLDDVFVYPIGEDRPSDDEWTDEILSVVGGMQTWLNVDVIP